MPNPTPSASSDPYDPKPVIQYAYEMARKRGIERYVVTTRRFQYATQAPTPQFSHWKVMPNGDTFAHVAEAGVTEYKYEPLKDK